MVQTRDLRTNGSLEIVLRPSALSRIDLADLEQLVLRTD